MKILIELPTWLGDTVMATPAIENLANFFNDSQLTLIGSNVAVEALKSHPKVIKTMVLDRKYSNLYKNGKALGEFDFFFSFRGSIRSKIMKFFITANKKYQFDKNRYLIGHQVEKYNNFLNDSLNIDSIAGKLALHIESKDIHNHIVKKNRLLGINPGATYGNAKCWYPEEFAKVAIKFSVDYDIVIFGSEKEKKISLDIENFLIKKGVTNFQNLTGKTNIPELMDEVSKLDWLISGDSGPIHLAAAFQIPTVTIFGPTKDEETSQWMNADGVILKKNLDCQPCMKRICPLKHHNCMKLIKSSDVIDVISSNLVS